MDKINLNYMHIYFLLLVHVLQFPLEFSTWCVLTDVHN